MAAINKAADAIQIFHTGAGSHAAAQTTPSASLGHYRSSTRATDVTVSAITSAITGLTVGFASGANGIGDGTLTRASASSLTWQAPGSSTAGPAVTFSGLDTLVVPDGDNPNAFIYVTCTDATPAFTGSASTLTLVDTFNNLIGFPNTTSAEASAGVSKYQVLAVLNNHPTTAVANVSAWLTQMGTQRLTGSAQLGSSGSGTVTTATSSGFADWTSNYALITDSSNANPEIIYFTSRTGTSLTVPASGRGLFGTTARAGASTDKIYCIPGMVFGIETPSAPTGYVQTLTNINTAPSGITWLFPVVAPGSPNIAATIAAGAWMGLHVWQQVPAGATATPSILFSQALRFDAA